MANSFQPTFKEISSQPNTGRGTSRYEWAMKSFVFHSVRPDTEYEDFMTGFVVDNSQVWGRPVGIAVAPDGSLFVSDDGSGSIWRIRYSPSS